MGVYHSTHYTVPLLPSERDLTILRYPKFGDSVLRDPFSRLSAASCCPWKGPSFPWAGIHTGSGSVGGSVKQLHHVSLDQGVCVLCVFSSSRMPTPDTLRIALPSPHTHVTGGEEPGLSSMLGFGKLVYNQTEKGSQAVSQEGRWCMVCGCPRCSRKGSCFLQKE